MSDRLRDLIPGTDKRFRDMSLTEQNEILFRFLEEIMDEVRALRKERACRAFVNAWRAGQ